MCMQLDNCASTSQYYVVRRSRGSFVIESLLVIKEGSEFQTDGAEHRKLNPGEWHGEQWSLLGL